MLASLAVGLALGGPGPLPSAEGVPPSEAERLFRRFCAACHGMQGRGDGPNAPSLGETQPRNLTDPLYMGKLSDDHLLKVIAEGGRSVGRSPFMPAFGRTIPAEQLRALVAYVRAMPRGGEAPGAREAKGAEEGARLVAELGCPNCHKVGDLPPEPVAPPLERAGEKFRAGWLAGFLKAPHPIRAIGYIPLSRSRMPTFRLSPEEAESLAAYLLSRRGGREEPKAGAPCPPDAREGGYPLLLQYGCRACHAFAEDGAVAGPDLGLARDRIRRGWVARFIQDPQSLDPLAAMPRLGVPGVDACALAAFLAREEGEEERRRLTGGPVARGKALFENLGCGGCHGGAGSPKPLEGAPDLTYLGDKLRPEWLRRFLKAPQPLRAWLKVRMPDFSLSDREVEALTSYFVLRRRGPAARRLPHPAPGDRPPAPANVERGRALFALYECAKCHPDPGAPLRAGVEVASLAPSLADAGRRLRPDWVLRFLRDPQSVSPGTKMPSFFYDSGEPIEPDAEAKALALRDFLISLGR